MTRNRLGFLLLTALIAAVPAFSQNLPVPAKNSVTCDAGTLVTFPGCLNFQGKTFPGWQQAPVAGFTGRWFDSADQKSWQGGYRTSRGMGLRISDRRIYWITLSAVMAYDPTSFINTLSSQVQENKLIPGLSMGIQGTFRSEPQDLLLRPDQFFNPEGSSSWTTFILDGEQRMFDIDFDDRGYVYLATGPFGWGVVKDDFTIGGNWMTSAFQHIEAQFDPLFVQSVRAGSEYFALVNAGDPKTQIWNVSGLPSHVAPTHTSDLPFQLRRGAIARSSDGRTIAIIYSDGTIRLYDPSTLVRGGNPTPLKTIAPPSGGSFTSVTSDDHNNFFASTGGSATISAIAPDGTGTYSIRMTTPLGVSGNFRIQYGANLITGIVYESFGANIRLYSVLPDLSVSELTPTPPNAHFFADYYRLAGSPIAEAVPFKIGTKTYLGVSTYALGDVYELQTFGNAVNLVATPSSIVYGEPVTFTVTSGSVNKPIVNVAFGDGGTATAAPRTLPPDYDAIPYTYGVRGNPLPGNAPSKKMTAQATVSTDANVFATADVTINAPQQIGFGVQGRPELLFLSPNATAAPTIVAGDQFIDVSSGSAASHKIDWTITSAAGAPLLQQLGAAPTATVPAVPSTVTGGNCGAYHLTFLAHYGPTGGDAPYYLGGKSTLDSFGYSEGYVVKPFGVTIKQDSSDNTGTTFTASSRFSATDVTGDSCTYHWYIYDDANPATPKYEDNNTKTCRLGSVPSFVVPRANTVQGPMTVKLTVTATGALSASCQSSNVQTVTIPFTGTANCPTMQASDFSATYFGEQTFCTSNPSSAACNANETIDFQVRAVNGASCTPYTISWNFGDGGTATQSDFATVQRHAFATTGQKAASVTISDGSGQSGAGHSVTLPLTVNVGGSNPNNGNCAAISPSNLQITYYSQSYSCTSNGGTCNPNESITFSVSPYNGYSQSCGPYSYTWNFDDGSGGQASGGASNPTGQISHSFASRTQPYTVTVQVTDGASHSTTLTVPRAVSVGTSNPGGNGNCPAIGSSNLQISYYSQSYSCTSNGGTCGANENITFSIQAFNGYTMSCGPYSYVWNFDDGKGTKTISDVNNPTGSISYSFAGRSTPYNVTVQVTDGGGHTVTLTAPRPVTVSGGPTCTAPAATNLKINPPACASSPNGCDDGNLLSFSVAPVGSFDFSCGPYTYTWDFGDHVPVVGDSSQRGLVQHKFIAGQYTVSVTVRDASSQTTTLTFSNFTVNTATGFKTPCDSPSATPTDLCLSSNHYLVSITGRDDKGKTAPGLAVAQRDPFGYFAIPELSGNSATPEVFVKVLEIAPGRPWVFYAGLTNLEYEIKVTDKNTGKVFNTYKVLPPTQDPRSLLPQQAIGDYDVDGQNAHDIDPVKVKKQCAAVQVIQNRTVPTPGTCPSNTNSLCLLDRFAITLFARTNTDTPKGGLGATIRGNSQFGFFTTPDIAGPNDVQGFIKMIDASSIKQGYWVFLGGLTDFELTYTVTDTQTGNQKIYIKPAASTCGWNDTGAF